jgi:hypothetical protein
MKSKRILWLVLAFLAALLLWAGIDLFFPRRQDIRRFDPNLVAHLDTVMWRSYYERRSRDLFLQLAELMRLQFRFPLLRSNQVAGYAAKAAFIFKDGRDRADYERALPYLELYFQEIHDISDRPFNVRQAAKLELEWWIVHRERGRHEEGDLARAVAEAAAELYQVPADNLMDYGRFRADAMKIRDTKAVHDGLTESDWRAIESDLLLAIVVEGDSVGRFLLRKSAQCNPSSRNAAPAPARFSGFIST